MKIRSLTLVATALLAVLTGCKYSAPDPPNSKADTYRPVYLAFADARLVQTLGPQPLKLPGKIYVKDNFLLINEIGRGIHVVDNRDPAKPVKLSFISIPGNRELAIKDSILYADNALDIVALNIADPRNVRLVKRLENTFSATDFPDARNIRFECPDPEKGVVIRWEKTAVSQADCYR
jgi:hypothetical protein